MLMLLAQAGAEASTQQLAVSYGWLLVKMIVVLVIVCVLAVLILKYLVPKLGRGRPGGGEYITVVSRRSLDHKQHLWIVSVGTRHFFLGSGAGAVTCLAELTPEEIGGGRRVRTD